MKANETIDMKLCKTGSFEEIKSVLKSMTDRDQFLRDRDKEGFCAIHYASERPDEYIISVLRLLINYGPILLIKRKMELQFCIWLAKMVMLRFASIACQKVKVF